MQLFDLMDIGKMGTVTLEAFQAWWLAGQRSPEKYAAILNQSPVVEAAPVTRPQELEKFIPDPSKDYPKLVVDVKIPGSIIQPSQK
jgi:hypothetical protein